MDLAGYLIRIGGDLMSWQGLLAFGVLIVFILITWIKRRRGL